MVRTPLAEKASCTPKTDKGSPCPPKGGLNTRPDPHAVGAVSILSERWIEEHRLAFRICEIGTCPSRLLARSRTHCLAMWLRLEGEKITSAHPVHADMRTSPQTFFSLTVCRVLDTGLGLTSSVSSSVSLTLDVLPGLGAASFQN